MNNIYFVDPKSTDQCMSSTAAGEIKNRGNEISKDLGSQLKAISFVNQEINIIGSGESGKQTSKIGTTIEGLKSIKSMIERIGRLNAFNAWITKAIKEKELGCKEVNEMGFDTWIDLQESLGNHKDLIKTYREKPEPLKSKRSWISDKKVELGISEPELPEKMSLIDGSLKNEKDWEIDYLNLGIGDLSVFLLNQATAAVYGNMIHHETDPLKKAKDEYYKRLNDQKEIQGVGRETVIYSYTPSIPDSNVIDGVFSDLHAQHRLFEKTVNSYRYKAKSKIEELNDAAETENIEISGKYSEELREYRKKEEDLEKEWDKLSLEYRKADDAWSKAFRELQSLKSKWTISEKSRIGRLKIVVPKIFLDLYQELNDACSTKE